MPPITPLTPPYDPEVADLLEPMMPPGVQPIALFRTFVKNRPMTRAMQRWGGYALSRDLSLSLRLRELVIDRVTARCGAEYEWGVHVAFFAERAGFDPAQIRSLTHGDADDPCWTDPTERAVLAAVDELHDQGRLSPQVADGLAEHLDEAQRLDLALLAGWYHAISYAANVAELPNEPGAPTFADI